MTRRGTQPGISPGGGGGGGSDLFWLQPVRTATDAALPANTPAGGPGPGKTLTANANGALTVDGVAMNNGDRVLVKDEATTSDNGIYTVTDAGSGATPWILTRATDFDTDAEVVANSITSSEEGATNADRIWILSTNNPITVDVTGQTWIQAFVAAGNNLQQAYDAGPTGTVAPTNANGPVRIEDTGATRPTVLAEMDNSTNSDAVPLHVVGTNSGDVIVNPASTFASIHIEHAGNLTIPSNVDAGIVMTEQTGGNEMYAMATGILQWFGDTAVNIGASQPLSGGPVGQAGGDLNLFAADAESGDAVTPGGAGGITDINAGQGGDGSATQAAGDGGALQITAGNAGLDNGGGGAGGGALTIDGGSSSGALVVPNVTVTTGDNPDTGAGGFIVLESQTVSGAGADGGVAIGAGSAAPQVSGFVTVDATAGITARADGNITLDSDGATSDIVIDAADEVDMDAQNAIRMNVNAVGANNPITATTADGSIQLTCGGNVRDITLSTTGVDSDIDLIAGESGDVVVSAGNGGATSGGGGTLNITAGDGSGANNAGGIDITAGNVDVLGGAVNGGIINITAGNKNAVAGSAGGDVNIEPGSGGSQTAGPTRVDIARAFTGFGAVRVGQLGGAANPCSSVTIEARTLLFQSDFGDATFRASAANDDAVISTQGADGNILLTADDGDVTLISGILATDHPDRFIQIRDPGFTDGANNVRTRIYQSGDYECFNRVHVQGNFVGGLTSPTWVSSTSGTGTAAINTGDSAAPYRIGSGGTSGGIGRLETATNHDFMTIDGEAMASFKLRTGPDGSATFFFGICTAGGGGFGTGTIYSRFVNNTGTGNWDIETSNGVGTTTADSGVAHDEDPHTFTILEGQTGGIHFYIDGVEVSNSPISTNLPTAGTKRRPVVEVTNTANFDRAILIYQVDAWETPVPPSE